MQTMTDGLLGFSNTCAPWPVLKSESSSSRKKSFGKLLVSSLAVRIFSELNGNSKDIAVVCFIIEEMVSRRGLGAVSG